MYIYIIYILYILLYIYILYYILKSNTIYPVVISSILQSAVSQSRDQGVTMGFHHHRFNSHGKSQCHSHLKNGWAHPLFIKQWEVGTSRDISGTVRKNCELDMLGLWNVLI